MCPFSLEQPSTICAFSHLGCHLQKTSQNIPFRFGLSPVDTGVPYCLLMLRNSLKDFAFEHRSGCCATEPGYAGNIGAIEIWLIDWLIHLFADWFFMFYVRPWKDLKRFWSTTDKISTVTQNGCSSIFLWNVLPLAETVDLTTVLPFTFFAFLPLEITVQSTNSYCHWFHTVLGRVRSDMSDMSATGNRGSSTTDHKSPEA